MKSLWKSCLGALMLMLGILILAEGASLPADTTHGKLVVFIGGLLVVGAYMLTWTHFHNRLEGIQAKHEANKVK